MSKYLMEIALAIITAGQRHVKSEIMLKYLAVYIYTCIDIF